MKTIETTFDVGDRCRIKKDLMTYKDGIVCSLIISRTLDNDDIQTIEVYDVRLDDGEYICALTPSDIMKL